MNKLLHAFWLFLVLATGCLFPLQQAKASHYIGSDLTFAYTGTPGWYLLRLNFYRDCGGITPGSLSIDASMPGCTAITNIPLTLGPVPYEVSEVCPSQTTECDGNNSIPGVEYYEYSALVNLGTTCNGNWTFVFSSNARNDGIINLNNGNTDILAWYTDAYLNTGVLGQINNSPIFSSSPAPYVCLNDTVFYNPQVTDPDGDSLVYSLVAARAANGVAINYSTGYSAVQPFGIAGFQTTLDPQTGQLVFKPTATGGFVVVLKVEEYRYVNGVATLMGFVHRDVQVQVIACNTTPPILQNLTLQTAGQPDIIFAPDTIQVVQACVPYCIQIPAITTQTNATLTMTSNAANEVPNSTFTVTGAGTQSIVGTLCFEPDPELADQVFSFTFGVSDDACPVPNDFVRAISIKVVKSTGFRVASATDSICADTDVQLITNARPNTVPVNHPDYLNFTWTAEDLQGQEIPGFFQNNDSTIVNPVVSPKVTTRYVLTSNSAYGCVDTSSVVIFVKGIQPTITSLVPGAGTLCIGQSTTLTPTIAGPASLPDTVTWNYNWGPSGLSDSTIANPTVAYDGTDTMTYTLVVSNGTCSDTSEVTVNFVPPATVTTSPDLSVCAGDTIQLTALASGPGATGSSYSWISGDRISSPTDSVTDARPLHFGVVEYVVQVTTPLGCVVTDTVLVGVGGAAVNIEPLQETITLCEDQTTPITIVVNVDPEVTNPQLTYNWTPAIGVSDPSSANPVISYVPGNNTVTYTVMVASGTCDQTETFTVNFVPSVAIAPSASPTTLCLGDTVDLKAVLTPAGVFGATVNWTGNGVNPINDTVTYAVPQNTGSYFYNVEVVLSENCRFEDSVLVNVEGVRPTITNISAIPNPICFGDSSVLSATVTPSFMSDPAPNFVYNWIANRPGGGIENPNSLTTTIRPDSTTTYQLTVSDEGTCAMSQTIQVQAGEEVDPSYSVIYNPDSLAAVSATQPLIVTFTNNTITDGPIDSVIWVLQNINDASAPAITLRGNPQSATYEFTQNSQYNVTMSVYTPGGCVYTLQKPLWIGAFTVPNVITPNGDGVNDVFYIANLKPNTTVMIFNRWGKKVSEFGQGGKWEPGSDIPDGVYFYSVDEKNTGRTYKGWLEVIR